MELIALLEKMKLEHLADQIDSVCEQAAGKDLDYKAFLTQALETEYRGRFQRGTEARIKQARFPWVKTLDQFDFDFPPSLDRKLVRELAGLVVRRARPQRRTARAARRRQDPSRHRAGDEGGRGRLLGAVPHP